jgi:hypothetical protein
MTKKKKNYTEIKKEGEIFITSAIIKDWTSVGSCSNKHTSLSKLLSRFARASVTYGHS